ncbi:DUF2759 domain-containing protein [Bacillus sp. HMF5848]|uniref:DUF2759 domain-containing protein n=1 Tax=Bacillus sp. HMF5848 TaxID=2495421 RepID=UPI000F7A526C|nr:DUF2759 domain-containing protein [Bacillus sp. HMF5848]RSK27836.1 DUF2759 domain-containing protein [Bacillus sp. HMF5848]
MGVGLVIIFFLVTVLGVFSLLKTLKAKNMIGILFSLATIAIFGWFSIMTFINAGYPQVTH